MLASLVEFVNEYISKIVHTADRDNAESDNLSACVRSDQCSFGKKMVPMSESQREDGIEALLAIEDHE
ncbi:hypothetical protein MIR68_010758 [Amoeboaphelidium protococcarum]|nr:hypothetical protein MIR68_010758 [Amoeboaphelidium protococcarum]